MFRNPSLLLRQGNPEFQVFYAFRIIHRDGYFSSELICQTSDPATAKYPVDVVTFPKEDTVWITPVSQKLCLKLFTKYSSGKHKILLVNTPPHQVAV